MALIKTPYGLVYNTDGTLCTTYRDDVVPFAGVRSFAVEAPTTNLVNVYTFQNCLNKDVTSSIENVDTLFGKKDVVKIMKSGTGDRLRFKVLYYPALNEEIAITLFVKPINGLSRVIIAQNYGTVKTYTFATGKGHIKDGWHKITHKFVSENTNKIELWLDKYSSSPEGNEGCYVISQVESGKRYFTSYVDESRPKGRLVISVEDLMFDIANDDWVISYWKYPVATRDGTQNGYNICSLGQWTSGLSKGYIWWGKVSDTNKYGLRVIFNDATDFLNISDNTFNPTDYFYHWHYEVVKKSGKVLSYYVDGVKQCEATIPANKKLQTPFDVGLSLGGYTAQNIFYPDNTLIAAPYYGYNSATWTDEYIREVYEAKMPFAVQNQLSIY